MIYFNFYLSVPRAFVNGIPVISQEIDKTHFEFPRKTISFVSKRL